jgi:hypothetical protein
VDSDSAGGTADRSRVWAETLMYEYLATVLRVVDGDTMHFDCEGGPRP